MGLIDRVLTDDHRDLRERADAFAEEVVAPRAEAIESSDEFPRDVLEAAGDRGLLGVLLPPEYGGEGGDFLGYCLVVERIARASGAVAESIQGHAFAALPLARHGTEAQRERYLEPMATGEAIGAMLLTEPGAGSSPSALESVAEATPDGYRLAGEKAFGTNAGVADVHLVVARKRPAPDDSHGVSVFLVPGVDEVDGLAFDRTRFMGMRGHVTGDTTLDGVAVPADALLG
ncbi:MAG: acyl-CoA dehydrogenase family protein, partial [Halobacteriales archaeon]